MSARGKKVVTLVVHVVIGARDFGLIRCRVLCSTFAVQSLDHEKNPHLPRDPVPKPWEVVKVWHDYLVLFVLAWIAMRAASHLRNNHVLMP